MLTTRAIEVILRITCNQQNLTFNNFHVIESRISFFGMASTKEGCQHGENVQYSPHQKVTILSADLGSDQARVPETNREKTYKLS